MGFLPPDLIESALSHERVFGFAGNRLCLLTKGLLSPIFRTVAVVSAEFQTLLCYWERGGCELVLMSEHL